MAEKEAVMEERPTSPEPPGKPLRAFSPSDLRLLRTRRSNMTHRKLIAIGKLVKAGKAKWLLPGYESYSK